MAHATWSDTSETSTTSETRKTLARSIAAAVVLIATGVQIAHSQTVNPVAWSARSPTPIATGGTGRITVTAAIQPGWHVYSLTQPEGGPIALTFKAATGQPATLSGVARGPKPRAERQPAFDVPVELYDEGTREFTVSIKLSPGTDTGKRTIKLVATWQACSSAVCLPPKSQDIPVDVTVVPKVVTASVPTKTKVSSSTSTRRRPPVPLEWDAVIIYDSLNLPFPLELRQTGTNVQATLFNGSERVVSTSGRRVGDSIFVAFDHLASELRGQFVGKTFTGTFGNTNGRGVRPVTAQPHKPVTLSAKGVPNINGAWYVPARSQKGERAWRFVVQQRGARATATTLRVDGDAGAHIGTWRDGKFVLSHFDGTRPSQYEIVPNDSGIEITTITQRGRGRPVTALRPDVAIAQGLPLPADFMNHTRMKDSTEVFRFSFPDINGNLISNTDARFANKVILVAIGGTWCPNCHDEAPFLTRLYKKYHARGLEIVALDFEDSTQLKTLARPKAFVKKYGITYPFLLAGIQAELNQKITQADSLDSWPTTFFLGRDGRVRAIHAGFAAAASGEFHAELVKEYTAVVERLLAEKPVALRADQVGANTP